MDEIPSQKYGDRINRLLLDIEKDYGADLLAHWLLSLSLTMARELYGSNYTLKFYKQLQEKLEQYTEH